MAKSQNANVLEQHVEKIVLGLCVVVLIVVAARWGPSSPLEVQVPGPGGTGMEGVPPSEVDERLAQAAELIRARNLEANAPPLPTLTWVKQFGDVARKPFPPLAMKSAMDLGIPGVQVKAPAGVDSNGLPALPDLLALVPPPGKPAGWYGYECRQPANPIQQAFDEVVYRGSSDYPVGELRTRWGGKLHDLPVLNITVLAVEVQWQSHRPGAAFAAGEGSPLKTIALPPEDGQKPPVRLALPAIPDYDGNNADVVRPILDLIGHPAWQQYILTPPYPNVFQAGSGYVTWRIHLAATEATKLGDLLLPGGPALETFPPAGTAPPPTGMGPSDVYRPSAPPPTGMGGPARVSAPPPTGMGGPPAGTAPPPTGYGPPAGGYTPATPAAAVAGSVPVYPEGPEALTVRSTPIAPVERQLEGGLLAVVFHDNTLQRETYFRYRVRLVLLNPLYAHPSYVRDDRPEDALVKEVRTPWSEWSDPAIVENPTRFFLSGPLAPDGTVRATVFTRKLGQTVKADFTVRAGMLIGSVANTLVAGLLGGTTPEEADFSTGCVVVDLQERSVFRTGWGGTKIETKTTVLTYLTEKGELETRVLAEDEASADYKKYQAEAVK